jgi:hypothetical protein
MFGPFLFYPHCVAGRGEGWNGPGTAPTARGRQWWPDERPPHERTGPQEDGDILICASAWLWTHGNENKKFTATQTHADTGVVETHPDALGTQESFTRLGRRYVRSAARQLERTNNHISAGTCRADCRDDACMHVSPP